MNIKLNPSRITRKMYRANVTDALQITTPRETFRIEIFIKNAILLFLSAILLSVMAWGADGHPGQLTGTQGVE